MGSSQIVEIELLQAVPSGGSGKAEGFADGGWATIGKPALADATQNSRKWDGPNKFVRATQDWAFPS